MKHIKQATFVVLTVLCLFSALSIGSFAGTDENIETPPIPFDPSQSAVKLNYSYDDVTMTATVISYSGTGTKASIPSSVTKNSSRYAVTAIGENAFKDNKKISNVTIASGITSIGAGAFSGCSALTNVTIPDTVAEVGYQAFSGTKWYDAKSEGVVYIGKALYAVKGVSPETIFVSDGTISVTAFAFTDCATLRVITMPNSISKIGASAFANCTALEIGIIPSSVTQIGDGFANGATKLTVYGSSASTAETVCNAANIPFVSSSALILMKEPDKTEYIIGESFSVEGAVLYYINDEKLSNISIKNSMISGFSSKTIGEQTISVHYEGLSVEYSVTVVPIPKDLNQDGTFTEDDAIFLLYHVMFSGDADYELNQEADYNQDGSVTAADAVYLLYHLFFPETYHITA